MLDDLSSNAKVNLTVFGSSILGGVIVAPGAVYCAEKVLPHQMEWLKKILSEKVIQPHLKFFEKMSVHATQAHEKHEQKKLDKRIAQGEKIEDEKKPELTPKEKADKISTHLVKAAVALGSDFISTYGIQALMNKMLKIHIKPGKVAFLDTVVHLLGIVAMPTLLATPAEWMRQGISGVLQKTLGMKEKTADDAAISFTYVGAPGLAGMAAAWKVAHMSTKGASR